ncbi:MAG: hypothetical protein RLN88_05060 [Ekhidna sp.]|uniref:hypothetical protein n=1 Tax=Ekhidna sp. TaxID=2608089 RepID=UPI0032EDD5B3
MRKLLFTIGILIGLGEICANVVVLDAAGHGDYATMSDAIANSGTGDTIYVVGSAASYGNFTLSTERTFIGNGYYGQSIGYSSSSSLGNITLNPGAANSVFSNLEIGTITFNESNITFDACIIGGSFTIGSSISNISYSRCLFTSPIYVQSSSVSFSNSIFNYASSGNGVTVSGGSSPAFDYCTFFDGNISFDASIVSNSVVNSSRVGQTPVVVTDGVSGNKVDTEANLLFETSLGNDGYFQLQSGSPGKTSSQTGAESGAFGYPTGQPENAYLLSGLPAIPKITALEFESSSNSSSNLSIRIQATTN